MTSTADNKPDDSKSPARRRQWSWWKILGLLLLVAVAARVAQLGVGWWRFAHREQSVKRMVQAEEVMLGLTPHLRKLQLGMLDLRGLAAYSQKLWDHQVTVNAIEPHVDDGKSQLPLGIERTNWHVTDAEQQVVRGKIELYGRLLAGVRYFDNASFQFVRGDFDPDDMERFHSDLVFHALARTVDGSWREYDIGQQVTWRREPAAASGWLISRWRVVSVRVDAGGPAKLFHEVLADVLPDPATVRRTRRSLHDENIVALHERGELPFVKPQHREMFTPDATFQHPAVAVVDINGDGWDDIYVMRRWGKNLLLESRGDGTFAETGADRKLDIDGQSSSGVFADFDNDGDPDLILGRALERSVYLVNEDGVFVDHTERAVSVPLPYFVAAVSAADYNQDGLLDVYLSTYALPGNHLTSEAVAARFLPPEQAKELFAKSRQRGLLGRYIESVGPPNLLLVNRGGRFETAAESKQVELWRNSLQSTWADYDNDGDVDLYVANDFAPDYLLRNDGPQGFRDVTRQQGGEAMAGFGMGASFGDYDNDGRQDLYVSNMYSKAGVRITANVPGLDRRFRRSAEGNRLFRNTGQRMELVSSDKPGATAVAKAGWSWGGQFVDVDNDGRLDLYVPSGYYTAPAAIAQDIDL